MRPFWLPFLLTPKSYLLGFSWSSLTKINLGWRNSALGIGEEGPELKFDLIPWLHFHILIQNLKLGEVRSQSLGSHWSFWEWCNWMLRRKIALVNTKHFLLPIRDSTPTLPHTPPRIRGIFLAKVSFLPVEASFDFKKVSNDDSFLFIFFQFRFFRVDYYPVLKAPPLNAFHLRHSVRKSKRGTHTLRWKDQITGDGIQIGIGTFIE